MLKRGDQVYAVRLQWGDVQPDLTIKNGGLPRELPVRVPLVRVAHAGETRDQADQAV